LSYVHVIYRDDILFKPISISSSSSSNYIPYLISRHHVINESQHSFHTPCTLLLHTLISTPFDSSFTQQHHLLGHSFPPICVVFPYRSCPFAPSPFSIRLCPCHTPIPISNSLTSLQLQHHTYHHPLYCIWLVCMSSPLSYRIVSNPINHYLPQIVHHFPLLFLFLVLDCVCHCSCFCVSSYIGKILNGLR
jgi:hypothetical protein